MNTLRDTLSLCLHKSILRAGTMNIWFGVCNFFTKDCIGWFLDVNQANAFSKRSHLPALLLLCSAKSCAQLRWLYIVIQYAINSVPHLHTYMTVFGPSHLLISLLKLFLYFRHFLNLHVVSLQFEAK